MRSDTRDDIIAYHRYLNSLSLEDTRQLLIDIKAFQNEGEIEEALKTHACISEVIRLLSNKKIIHRYTLDPLIRYNFLEALLFACAKGSSSQVKHPEILAYDITTMYDFDDDAQCYCAYRIMHMKITELIQTCQHYQITTLFNMKNDVLQEWIQNYIKALSKFVLRNEKDLQILQQLEEQFYDFPVEVEFLNEELTPFDFMNFSMMLNHTVFEWFYYDRKKEIFYNEEGLSILHEDEDYQEDDLIRIESDIVERKQILYSFIRNAKLSEDTRWELLDITDGHHAFRECKKEFAKLKILDDFHIYQDAVIQVIAIGWCLEHHYQFNDQDLSIIHIY